jgi:hypothetical protein
MMKSTIYMLGIQLRYYMKLNNDKIQNQMEKTTDIPQVFYYRGQILISSKISKPIYKFQH